LKNYVKDLTVKTWAVVDSRLKLAMLLTGPTTRPF
jgi:hypothetical protein